jgi:hypothetical protein
MLRPATQATSHASKHNHAFASLLPREREGLTLVGRRSVLKAGIGGLAGLSLPALLADRAAAVEAGRAKSPKSVILLWMCGGPSHIDTWDVKPNAPVEIRGPFDTISTKLPGVSVCEFLPKQAAMLDKFTLIRSVDCRHSNHQPNQVMQTANHAAEPRINKQGDRYPAIASVVAKHHGANEQGMPPYVALNVQDRTHIAWGGYLGKQYDPFLPNNVGQRFELPLGLSEARLDERRVLLARFDQIRKDLDLSGSMDAMDRYTQQAMEMVSGRRAQEAFDISRESQAMRDRYGKHPWAQQALLARRLVESGVAFVTIDLSNHSASGTWDTHGDNIPPYGGIWSGLRPLLPVFDHLITTLVSDLEERGLLDQTLVLAMGEFGRSPQIGTQGSTDGRNHWPFVMSMALAGGGMRHGQVIGASTSDGGTIQDRPVTPGDLAATIFRHMDVPVNVTYTDLFGRPNFILEEGTPVGELF